MIWGIAIGVLVLIIVACLGSCLRVAGLADQRDEEMFAAELEHKALEALYHCEMSETERKDLEAARWN